jgi:hypothetical protein
MHLLEQTIQDIQLEYQFGNITKDERDYMLQEVRDIRAAQECAGNEEMFRHIVQACNVAMAVV